MATQYDNDALLEKGFTLRREPDKVRDTTTGKTELSTATTQELCVRPVAAFGIPCSESTEVRS